MTNDTLSINRRSYNRLKPLDEAELVQLWEAGGHTADDLATRFGLSRRGVQAALVRLGARKKRQPVSAAPSALSKLHELALAEPLPASTDPTARTAAILDAAFTNAAHLEVLTMAMVDDAAATGGIAALRALDIAASALARITTIKRQAMGLGATNPILPGDLPELPIRELSEAEVAAIRDQQLADDEAFGVVIVDDDLITEGDEADRFAARGAA